MTDTWHILGRGAIGLLWADALNQLGLPVHLLLKEDAPAEPSSVQLTTFEGEQQSFSVTASGYEHSGTIDKLVVPLKAFDVLPALQRLKPQLHPQTVIILCHNGLGTLEQVHELFDYSQPLLVASTTHGAYREDHWQVSHTGKGDTKMGWITTPSQGGLTATLNQILPPVSWHLDIEAIMWQKLAINCVTQPTDCHLSM